MKTINLPLSFRFWPSKLIHYNCYKSHIGLLTQYHYQTNICGAEENQSYFTRAGVVSPRQSVCGLSWFSFTNTESDSKILINSLILWRGPRLVCQHQCDVLTNDPDTENCGTEGFVVAVVLPLLLLLFPSPQYDASYFGSTWMMEMFQLVFILMAWAWWI